MKQLTSIAQCYMCEAPATSREHVPPLCLFPESKDAGGKDYRLNLITVPSCDAHNSKKKRDDEFLMLSLAGTIGNNSIGYRHRFGKVERAIRGNANRLLAEIVLHTKTVHRIDSVELSENQFFEVIWGTPDVPRLTRCFEHIAYGLHLHHFQRRFAGRLFIHFGYLVREHPNARMWNDFLRDRAALDVDGKAQVGSNSDLFHFQVSDADPLGYYLMRLCFYGGLDVYIAFQPSGVADAANLATALIPRGIRATIALGDRTYEFNRDSDA